MPPVRRKGTRQPRDPNAIGTLVEGGIKCVCGQVFKKQSDINKHFRENCPAGERRRGQCKYCSVTTNPGHMLRHIKEQHPEKVDQWKVVEREMSAADILLLEKLNEIGNPGGTLHHRNGYVFNIDKSLRLARYGFEKVDERCLTTPIDRRSSHWLTDKHLPNSVRISERDIKAGRGGIYHFCHLICAAYHWWDPQRIPDIMTSSIGMFQYECINTGAYKQLEMNFRFLIAYGDTYITSATTLISDPPRVGTKKLIAVAAGFIKIAAVFSNEKQQWWWDAYFIPNLESSTASPNQYRVKSFKDLDDLCDFKFLSNIRDVAVNEDLFAKGAEARLRWDAANQDSGIGMEIDNEEAQSAADSDSSEEEGTEAAAAESQASNDVPDNPYARVQQLEAENARLVMVNAQQAATIADQAAYIDVQNDRLSELIDFMTQLMERLQISPI